MSRKITPPPGVIVPQHGVAVTVSDGAIQLWGEQWVAIDKDLFERTDGRARLGFVRDIGGA